MGEAPSEGGEEGVDLGVGADGDPQAIPPASVMHEPNEDPLGLERLVDRAVRSRRVGAPDEVRLALLDLEAEVGKRPGEPGPGGEDRGPVGAEPVSVADGRGGRCDRERIAVVGILDLLELADDGRLGHREPESQPGQRVRLAEAAGHDHPVAAADEVEAVGRGEVAVGLVDDERTGEAGGERCDRVGGNERAGGAVGIGDDRQTDRLPGGGGGGAERRPERPVSLVRHLLAGDPLDAGERPVEDVARGRHPQGFARPDESADEDREEIVAAVAAQDPVGVDAEDLGRLLAKPGGHWVGILGEGPPGEERRHRASHLWRRSVGVFIGVELDPLSPLRLLPRHVAGEGGDPGSDKGCSAVGGGEWV